MPCKQKLCKVCLDNMIDYKYDDNTFSTNNKYINCPYCIQQINL